MSESKNSKREQIPAEFTQPETFRVAPITAYGSFENYLEDTEDFYGACEEAFLASDVKAADFPETCEKWADAARTMIMAAAALSGCIPPVSRAKPGRWRSSSAAKRTAGSGTRT